MSLKLWTLSVWMAYWAKEKCSNVFPDNYNRVVFGAVKPKQKQLKSQLSLEL